MSIRIIWKILQEVRNWHTFKQFDFRKKNQEPYLPQIKILT